MGEETMKKSIIIAALVAIAAGAIALATGTASASQPNEHANSYVQNLDEPNGGRASMDAHN
jgi:hypothetical protein